MRIGWVTGVWLVSTVLVQFRVDEALATEPKTVHAPASPATKLVREIEPEAQPFWREKESVYRRIKEERAVIVSVKNKKTGGAAAQTKGSVTLSEPGGRPDQRLVILGAGIIEASLEYSFAKAKQLEELKNVSSMIEEVRYDGKAQKAYVHGAAFGYHAKMWLQIAFREGPGFREIRWYHERGVLAGLAAVAHFRELDAKRTEVSFTGDHYYHELPMPRFFLTFGLEVAIQQIAKMMRAHIEESLRRDHAHRPKAA